MTELILTRFNNLCKLLITDQQTKDAKIFRQSFVTLVDKIYIRLFRTNLNTQKLNNYKYFYGYVLSLFLQNCVNAMIESMMNVYIKQLKNYENETYNKLQNILTEDDQSITNTILTYFKKNMIYNLDTIYSQIKKSSTTSIHNNIAIICLINYLQYNNYDFITDISIKIKQEYKINLKIIDSQYDILLNVETNTSNNLCVNCKSCMSCLCCYDCNDCVSCNCCIDCNSCKNSMHCINSMYTEYSYYISDSKYLFYCHKCCNCNICFYSDHLTDCCKVSYSSNISELVNSTDSFIYESSINNVQCYVRNILKQNHSTNPNIIFRYVSNIPKDLINRVCDLELNNDKKIYFLDYSAIIDKCYKTHKTSFKTNYTKVNDKLSLVQGCNYPLQNDIYFINKNNENFDDIAEQYCNTSIGYNDVKCDAAYFNDN